METLEKTTVQANQEIINAMVETYRILKRVSEIDEEFYKDDSIFDEIEEAQQQFYEALKKKLIQILDEDICSII